MWTQKNKLHCHCCMCSVLVQSSGSQPEGQDPSERSQNKCDGSQDDSCNRTKMNDNNVLRLRGITAENDSLVQNLYSVFSLQGTTRLDSAPHAFGTNHFA